jgi:endo-1,4-beta-xylanase
VVPPAGRRTRPRETDGTQDAHDPRTPDLACHGGGRRDGGSGEHGGDGAAGFGLAVTDRTRTWEGPTLDLLDTMEFGVTYIFSAWVRLAPGEPTGRLRMSVERRRAGHVEPTSLVEMAALVGPSFPKATTPAR